MLRPLLLAALCVAGRLGAARGCQLPSEWRPLSEGCRAELAEIIVYAKVLALHQEVHGLYNYLPWQYEPSDAGLFYSAEIEMLCDQAWGSMLEVPAGSRLNLTGLGYFSCHSHTVVQDYSYFFFLRMDENYNLLPHGVNFQDAIFPDTQENRRMFSSLFQFSNCSQGQHLATFSSDWEIQEDNRGQLFEWQRMWATEGLLLAGLAHLMPGGGPLLDQSLLLQVWSSTQRKTFEPQDRRCLLSTDRDRYIETSLWEHLGKGLQRGHISRMPGWEIDFLRWRLLMMCI
ncbi:coiled-coil domain-containing protein 3 isoform X1 [Felis catus]|uniref:coiled-coil domain-containing protein 3 isoform X1 n=1 Tax=Felis catus TaxID=9685 RepID=UPI001D19D5CB|nr:coiled-coil domain-containing protein 3 isoform X1 [Felis catus]